MVLVLLEDERCLALSSRRHAMSKPHAPFAECARRDGFAFSRLGLVADGLRILTRVVMHTQPLARVGRLARPVFAMYRGFG